MKNIITITLFLISFSGFSQSQYERGMEKALSLWTDNKPNEAVNLFERIAKAEPNEWLPAFYVSYITVIQGFSEKDEAILKSKMEKAQHYMNDAKVIANDEVELVLLDCLWHTVWVAYDGTTYGMTYGGKVTQLYQKAAKMEPNNPRVILNKAEWDIGGAKFFGQPTDPYCGEIQRAIDLFEEYTPKAKFYPKEGLGRAKQLFEQNCK